MEVVTLCDFWFQQTIPLGDFRPMEENGRKNNNVLPYCSIPKNAVRNFVPIFL